mmetsp:Transcript_32596/g.81703  ORF Transcript_32596/g.81703 Transcript_32596/m.81703 type:complete len:210 (+) Transcript_32596:203-832(+)
MQLPFGSLTAGAPPSSCIPQQRELWELAAVAVEHAELEVTDVNDVHRRRRPAVPPSARAQPACPSGSACGVFSGKLAYRPPPGAGNLDWARPFWKSARKMSSSRSGWLSMCRSVLVMARNSLSVSCMPSLRSVVLMPNIFPCTAAMMRRSRSSCLSKGRVQSVLSPRSGWNSTLWMSSNKAVILGLIGSSCDFRPSRLSSPRAVPLASV